MFNAALLVLLGIVILYFGAEALIRGGCALGSRFGIPSLIIGITIVALGTSLPETITTVIAHLQKGTSDIALGNIVGSNIANIGLVLGLSALARPLKVSYAVRWREMPIMVGVTIIFCLLLLQKMIGRVDGLLLFLGAILFILYQINLARKNLLSQRDVATSIEAPIPIPHHVFSEMLLCALGIFGLLAGAYVLVSGSIDLAEFMGISQRVIGLSVVAIGTSSPEIATSIVASLKKEHDVSVGNVVGSNLFNILFTIGLSSVLLPLPVSEQILSVDNAVMLGFTLCLGVLAWTVSRIGRAAGFAFVAAYVFYIGYLVYLP